MTAESMAFNEGVAHLRLVQVADEREWGGPRDTKLFEVLVGMISKAATTGEWS